MSKRCPNIQQILLCDCTEDQCSIKENLSCNYSGLPSVKSYDVTQDKEEQKKLLTKIMEADAKDGLYETWKDIEEQYLKDEYPVFGGPFNNAMTPFEWLKKYYYEPKRK
jgi:hypothetical protein